MPNKEVIMSNVTTKKELANAAKRGESQIIIEGDLAKHVLRIKLIGPIAWAVAFVSIGGAVYFYLATPSATVASAPLGGTGGAISFGAASTKCSCSCDYFRNKGYYCCNWYCCSFWWSWSPHKIKRKI
jgi:hypothetical protein